MRNLFLSIFASCTLMACATPPKQTTAPDIKVRAATNTPKNTINIAKKQKNAHAHYKASDFESAYNEYQTILLHLPKTDVDYDSVLLDFADSALGMYQANNSFKGIAKKIYHSVSTRNDQKTPLRKRANSGLTLLKYMGGELDKPIETLLSAVQIAPDDHRLWNALGLAYDKNEQWIGALDAYIHALKSAKENGHNYASVFNNMGVSLLMQNRTKQALTKFKQARKAKPEFVIYDNNRRMALLQLGRIDLALEGMEGLQRAKLYNDAGYYFENRGDMATAKQLYSHAIKQSPIYFKTAENNLESME